VKRITIIAAPLLPLFLLILACAQVEFNLELVDTKTMMENQVLGSYEELGEDIWMVSGVRGLPEEDLPSLEELAEEDPQRAAALLAYADSLFLDEELRRLKEQALLGETAEGYLAATPLLEDDPYLVELIERENANRRRIYERLGRLDPETSTLPDPTAETARRYGDLYLTDVPPGHRYRDAAGEWRQAD
jgi:uncharacterized protein YdbL (DUF1318 family)